MLCVRHAGSACIDHKPDNAINKAHDRKHIEQLHKKKLAPLAYNNTEIRRQRNGKQIAQMLYLLETKCSLLSIKYILFGF